MWGRFKLYAKSPWNIIEIILFTLSLVSILLRVLELNQAPGVESFTAVLAWLKILSFARGFRSTGAFVRMMFRIIERIVIFLVVLALIIIGFSHALSLLFRNAEVNVDGSNTEIIEDYVSWWVLMRVYFGMIGGFDFDEVRNARYPALAVSYLVLFTLLVSIVMLNLLIALMGIIHIVFQLMIVLFILSSFYFLIQLFILSFCLFAFFSFFKKFKFKCIKVIFIQK